MAEAAADTQARSVLVVAEWSAVLERVHAALEPAQASVEMTCALEDAALRAAYRRFDGIVLAYPEPPDEIGELLATVRRPGSASRTAGVVACCELPGYAAVARWTGVNRVLCIDAIASDLVPALDRLFHVAPRVRVTLPSRIEVPDQAFPRRYFCQTVNLSSSGMLLRVPHSLRPGLGFSFELFVSTTAPPLRGSASVVRLARPGRERFPAIGAAFTHLEGDGQLRLDAELRRFAA